ncbi:MarR family winged helix-turn-helix transcriptional regulator [Cohnella nanjingensis]|uniref:Winged helix-turn-helix transcriptional regulator n=1 Tax=Cohnella nanjingensis TaxID=1387779 RepID=A0A7X0RQW0_9BACL|nr:MarR family winged helix-turn-helix transcriptional regulator [Cohnella nanjingensis]MBB6672042.1 winged helix-turn-helix transcriptional regulator [Cohnella nanjingensis]
MDTNGLFRKFVAFTASVHQVKHEFTKDIRLDEITPLQYSMLEYIAVSQPVTLSDISDCLFMSMPNTSRELKKLSDKRLCEKLAVAGDRRKHAIRLSPQGQAMMDGVFGQMEARFMARTQDATPELLAEIEHALDVLQASVFYTERPKMGKS